LGGRDGIIREQVFMAAADVGMWLAIKTRFGLEDSSATAEMKTSFLGVARKVLKFAGSLVPHS
jgi:acyl-coenzyme A thioesterase PaaI-like protein